MATQTLNATVNSQKQGWYGSSTSGTNGTIKLTFPTFTEAANYTITDAKLYMTFSASGGDRAKAFNLTFSGTNSFSIDSVYTQGNAYNKTTYISLNSYIAKLSSWLSGGGTVITSVDPQPSSYFTTTSGGSTKYYSYNYCKVSAAYIQLTLTPNASSASFSSSTMSLGSSYTVTISAGDSSYLHDLTITSGSTTSTLLSSKTGGAYDFTVPKSLGSTFPNSTSASATFTLNTKNSSGTIIGTKTYSFTIKADSSNSSPTVSSVSYSTTSSNNVILGGITKITIVGTASGTNGATIKSYNLSIDGTSYGSNATGSFTITPSNTSKTSIATITATDSRGYTASKSSSSFYVNYYSYPTLTNLSFYRCDSSGNKDEIEGTYAKVSYGISAISVKNTSGTSVTNSATVSMILNGTTYNSNITSTIYGNGNLSIDTTYTATFTVKDSMGYSSTLTAELPSASYLLHFRKGQNSIGIGCAADNVGTSGKQIKVAWPLIINNTATFNSSIALSSPLGITSGGTGASTQANAFSNIVAPGGTISGALKLTGALTATNTFTVNGVSTFGSGLIVKNDATYPQIHFQVSGSNVINGMIYWNNNSKKMFLRSYNGSSSIYEDFSLPAATTSSTASYNILTTKDFYSGTVSISMARAWGWITASGKGISLCFPLSYRIPSNATISISTLIGNIRGGEGKYYGTSGDGSYVEAGTNFLSVCDNSTYIPEQGLLYIHLTLTGAASTNNRMLQYDGQLGFTIS